MARKKIEVDEHSNPAFHTPEQIEPPIGLDMTSPKDAPHNQAAIEYNRERGYMGPGFTE